MTIYSFHLFDRHCEQIFTRTWRQGTNTLSPSDLAKLIFGSTFSLRTTIRKLTPPSSLLEGQDYFAFHTSTYTLHFFETASSVRFVLMTSPPPSTTSSTHHTTASSLLPSAASSLTSAASSSSSSDLNYHVILRQIYERLYVEYIVKNPLGLYNLYSPAQRAALSDVKFGRDASSSALNGSGTSTAASASTSTPATTSRTRQQVKRKREIEAREGDVTGAVKGIGMVQGCELFSLALDQFLRSLDASS